MLFSFIISLMGLLFLLINSVLFNKTAKGKNKAYTIIRIYLTLLFVIELFCNIYGFLKPYSNFFLSHYYFIFQFILLSLFFRELFSNKLTKGIILFLLITVLLLLGYQYYTEPERYWSFNLIEIAVTSSLLILYASLFLIGYSKEYFYFCLGLIFYLSCSCYIFLSGNTDLILFTEPFFFDLWVFNSLFYIFYQFMIYKEWKVLNGK